MSVAAGEGCDDSLLQLIGRSAIVRRELGVSCQASRRRVRSARWRHPAARARFPSARTRSLPSAGPLAGRRRSGPRRSSPIRTAAPRSAQDSGAATKDPKARPPTTSTFSACFSKRKCRQPGHQPLDAEVGADLLRHRHDPDDVQVRLDAGACRIPASTCRARRPSSTAKQHGPAFAFPPRRTRRPGTTAEKSSA